MRGSCQCPDPSLFNHQLYLNSLWKRPFIKETNFNVTPSFRGTYQNLRHKETKACRIPVFKTHSFWILFASCVEKGQCCVVWGRQATWLSEPLSRDGPLGVAPFSFLGLLSSDVTGLVFNSSVSFSSVSWMALQYLSGGEDTGVLCRHRFGAG